MEDIEVVQVEYFQYYIEFLLVLDNLVEAEQDTQLDMENTLEDILDYMEAALELLHMDLNLVEAVEDILLDNLVEIVEDILDNLVETVGNILAVDNNY